MDPGAFDGGEGLFEVAEEDTVDEALGPLGEGLGARGGGGGGSFGGLGGAEGREGGEEVVGEVVERHAVLLGAEGELLHVVVVPRLDLTAVALGAEGEVEVAAEQTDPVPETDLLGQLPVPVHEVRILLVHYTIRPDN